MEERIIDKDDPRLIRLKRTGTGETDAVEEGVESGEEGVEEGEIVLSVPEGEFEELDEELIGLSPSQLKKELERRKKAEEAAREECAKLVEEGEKALAEKRYQEAASCFSQAAYYSFADERILKGLWEARTSDYTDLEPFYEPEFAQEFSVSDEEIKKHVLSRAGERLSQEKEEYEREEARIAPQVLEKQQERREAFARNKKYFVLRCAIIFAVCIALVVGCIVSATYIVRSMEITPIALTAAFGVAALGVLAVALVYTRKVIVASRLCRENEKLSSTKEGARLEYLRDRLYCLGLILPDGE